MMPQDQYRAESQTPAQAYARIRKAVGYCGFIIPLLCLSLALSTSCSMRILPSISHYYYTAIGDMFVGALAALGLFLILYRSVFEPGSLRQWENRITNLAGILAWIVAFVPTDPEGGGCYFIGIHSSSYEDTLGWLRYLHLPAAGLMILLFGVISWQFFSRDPSSGKATSPNRRYYRTCALVIFCSIGLLIAYFAEEAITGGGLLAGLEQIRIVFVMECIAVGAFALSWLKKGRAMEAIAEVWLDWRAKGKHTAP